MTYDTVQWDSDAGVWHIDVESTTRGAPAYAIKLSPEQAKALYYALEENFPTIDEQCGALE